MTEKELKLMNVASFVLFTENIYRHGRKKQQ